MSLRGALLAGVIGAGVGAAATFALVRSRPPRIEPADATSSSGPRSEGREAPPALVDVAPLGRSGAELAPSGARAGVTDPDSAARVVLDATPIALPPTASGTISGRVTTVEGQPVVGAVVRLQGHLPSSPPRLRGTEAAPSPEASLRRMAEFVKWSAATERASVTDGTGAYVLERLHDVSYSVHAEAAGFQIRPSSASDSRQLRAGATLDFVASPVVEVVVSVVRPDGSSATEAKVRWTKAAKGGGAGASWRAEAPTIQIPPGEWSVSAEAGESLRSPPLVVKVGEDPATLVLRLVERNRIVGKVRWDPADAGWSDVEVSAAPGGASRAGEGRRTRAMPPDWTFRFDDLPPGDYEFTAALQRGAPLATSSARIEGGSTKLEIEIPRLSPSQVLALRVLGPDGAAIDGADLELAIVVRRGTGSATLGARPGRRRDGTLLVALVDPDARTRAYAAEAGRESPPPSPDRGPAEWAVRATWKGQVREVPIDFGRTAGVDIRFE